MYLFKKLFDKVKGSKTLTGFSIVMIITSIFSIIFGYYVIFLRRKNKNINETLDAIKELNDKVLHKNG